MIQNSWCQLNCVGRLILNKWSELGRYRNCDYRVYDCVTCQALDFNTVA